MPDLNYELAPKPGQSASQRKQELDGARFIAIRNLAYMVYKKPDGTPLLSYPETLDDRERVKGMIIQHELALGLLVNDGGAVQPQPPQAQPMAQQPQGVPQMAQQPVPVMQFQQPQAATPQQAAQVPQQQFQQPAQQMQMQQPQFQQPQQMQQPVQQQFPQQQFQQQVQAQQPIAAPAQAAAAGEAAPTGRKRRGAGAAVAPPPAAPPPAGPVQPAYGSPPPQGQVMGQAPQQFMSAPAPQFNGQSQFPQQPPPQQAPQFAPIQQPQQPQFQQPVPQGVPAQQIDLSPVLQKIDLLGKGLEISAGNSDAALKAVADLRSDLSLVLIALNHIYLSMPQAPGQQSLGQLTQGRANDLPSFRVHLSQYLPK